jgi:UDP-GlcNAc:undecaprenyl-phosphate/decaprenyl-phosphate GlcNAc-1-phosphate transferase
MRTYLGLFALAALLTVLVTPLIERVGRRLSAYGGPREDRDARRIPRLGGLAIFAATLAAWGVLLLIPNTVRTTFWTHGSVLIIMLVPATLVLVLGMADDLVGATPWQKLMVEVLAAALVWWAGFRIGHLPLLGYNLHSVVSFVATVLWIVAVTNSLNLIDGLDGLAAGISLFVTLSVFFVSLLQENIFVCTLTITLAGALLGFLKFNFSPAKIFLGDTGSLFLGFLLAVLAIYTSQKSSTLLAIAVPFVAFGLPLFETALSVVRRFLSGRPVFVADLDHIHHRLVQRGLTPRVAVLLLYAFGALFSLGSLLVLRSSTSIIALVCVLAGVFAWFMTSQLQYEELSELNVYVARAMNSQRRVLANQIRIRKASRLLEESSSLEECWGRLTEALDALDFDRAACRLSAWPAGTAPTLPVWERLGGVKPDDCWSVSIPLRSGDRTLGVLELNRGLEKERLLFQFSSLLDTLVPPFERQLRLRYEGAGSNAKAGSGVEADSKPRAKRLATATEE